MVLVKFCWQLWHFWKIVSSKNVDLILRKMVYMHHLSKFKRLAKILVLHCKLICRGFASKREEMLCNKNFRGWNLEKKGFFGKLTQILLNCCDSVAHLLSWWIIKGFVKGHQKCLWKTALYQKVLTKTDWMHHQPNSKYFTKILWKFFGFCCAASKFFKILLAVVTIEIEWLIAKMLLLKY